MTAKAKQRPRHTVEAQPGGWVVVDWRHGRAVDGPLPHKELADGRAEQLNRLERAA